MKRWLNPIKRTWALFTMRSLEIELHDRTNALRYIATLPPGNRPTWRVA